MTNNVPVENFSDLIGAYAPTVTDFFFIQVGANNPRQGDPLYRFVTQMKWCGILIEPQQWVFENQLLPAYRNQAGLAFENAAIAEEDGSANLYKLSFSQQRWATGLASLSEGHLSTHIEAGYVEQNIGRQHDTLPESKEDYIEAEQVRTMSFDSLLDKYRPAKIDLLQIDAEGHDYQLLRLFDFARYRPGIVQFEWLHMLPEEKAEALDLMCGLDYLCFQSYVNTVCVQQAIVHRLGLGFAGPVLRRPALRLS